MCTQSTWWDILRSSRSLDTLTPATKHPSTSTLSSSLLCHMSSAQLPSCLARMLPSNPHVQNVAKIRRTSTRIYASTRLQKSTASEKRQQCVSGGVEPSHTYDRKYQEGKAAVATLKVLISRNCCVVSYAAYVRMDEPYRPLRRRRKRSTWGAWSSASRIRTSSTSLTRTTRTGCGRPGRSPTACSSRTLPPPSPSHGSSR